MTILFRTIKPDCRPLRPPPWYKAINRTFVNLLPLLQVSSIRPRPQVPFLSSSAHRHGPAQWHVARVISTEQRRFLRRTAWDLARAFAWIAVLLPVYLVTTWLVAQELLERDFPTPHEWSFRSRVRWHVAKALQDRSVSQERAPQWGHIAEVLEGLLQRLEDPSIDGAGLTVCKLLPVLARKSRLSFDLSSVYDTSQLAERKRRAYYLALFDAAKAAQALENMVVDDKSGLLHPRNVIIGPSNPDPMPVPPFAGRAAPLEEHCIALCPSADMFYKKLLSTRGLSDAEVIESRISYGEWLDDVGRAEDAERELRRALHIAANGARRGEEIVSLDTGIIKSDPPFVTRNILDASTALAVHLAKSGNLEGALPIFIAVLRAYRAIDATDETVELDSQRSYAGTIPADVMVSRMKERVQSLFQKVNYPSPPPSGNDAVERSGDESCQEAGAKLYAGEVLFATSPAKRDTALAWIKQAVVVSDGRVRNLSLPRPDRRRCNTCLAVALENWRTMKEFMKMDVEQRIIDMDIKPVRSGSDISPWRAEEIERWDWVKRVERENWDEKISVEELKLWTWMPTYAYTRVI